MTPILVKFLSCLLFMAHVIDLVNLSCPLHQYEHSGTCCDECRPGTFVLSNCTVTTPTVCGQCKDGTFSTDWSSANECSRCRRSNCNPTMGLVQRCNSTVDNQCGCVGPGLFHHIASDSCRNCKRCPPGQYPVRPCTTETICASCKVNYFSDIEGNFVSVCQKCRKCDIYDTKCNATHNAVCREHTVTKFAFSTTTPQRHVLLVSKSTEKDTPTVTVPTWKSEGDFPKLTIVLVSVCATLIIITLLVAAICRGRKRQILRRRCGFNVIQESRGLKGISFGGQLLREQPAEIIMGLHFLLNPETPNNWRALAAKLDFNYLQIRNFESNIKSATRDMLHDWGTSNNATLDRLYQALEELKRDDACEFLEEHVAVEDSETII